MGNTPNPQTPQPPKRDPQQDPQGQKAQQENPVRKNDQDRQRSPQQDQKH